MRARCPFSPSRVATSISSPSVKNRLESTPGTELIFFQVDCLQLLSMGVTTWAESSLCTATATRVLRVASKVEDTCAPIVCPSPKVLRASATPSKTTPTKRAVLRGVEARFAATSCKAERHLTLEATPSACGICTGGITSVASATCAPLLGVISLTTPSITCS